MMIRWSLSPLLCALRFPTVYVHFVGQGGSVMDIEVGSLRKLKIGQFEVVAFELDSWGSIEFSGFMIQFKQASNHQIVRFCTCMYIDLIDVPIGYIGCYPCLRTARFSVMEAIQQIRPGRC
jgi:hypothetical protein